MNSITYDGNGTSNQDSKNNNSQSTASSKTTDYYSIISALQHMLIRRQLEFQDSMAKWLKLKNPAAKMLLALF